MWKAGPVVGGEMEGIGPISNCPKDRPNWVVVKGIFDFADEDRDDANERGDAEKRDERSGDDSKKKGKK